jgi:MarR family transcriptional regulator, organic hydroperoxide resistance regulator
MVDESRESARRPPPSVGYLVWRLAVKWRAGLDRALRPLGLTSAQYGVLASLHGLVMAGARPSQRELADFVGLEPMFVSRLARALERRGLLERRSRTDDPRALQLALTARGVEVVIAARAIVVELEARRLAALGGSGSERSAALQAALLDLLGHAGVSERAAPAPRRSAAPPGAGPPPGR